MGMDPASRQVSISKSYGALLLHNFFVLLHMQLYNNLQPLNICLSYQGTLNLVEKLCQDHDVEVQFWADEIKNNVLTSESPVIV